MDSHRLPGGSLGDCYDGYLYHSSELFKPAPCEQQIQLYFDKLEVRNPLGSKTRKHKLDIKLKTM